MPINKMRWGWKGLSHSKLQYCFAIASHEILCMSSSHHPVKACQCGSVRRPFSWIRPSVLISDCLIANDRSFITFHRGHVRCIDFCTYKTYQSLALSLGVIDTDTATTAKINRLVSWLYGTFQQQK